MSTAVTEPSRTAKVGALQITFCEPSGHTPKIGDAVKCWRKGQIPEGGRSYNFRDKHHEAGVSCYWQPEATSFAGLDDRPWYVVSGVLVGYGSDGEPLLGAAKARKATKKDLRSFKRLSLGLQVGDVVRWDQYSSFADSFVVDSVKRRANGDVYGYGIRATKKYPLEATVPTWDQNGPQFLSDDEVGIVKIGHATTATP
jgi:hypothetical protein